MLESFSRFVPRQFLEFLGRDSIVDTLRGDAVQQQMSLLFCDIRNFTPMSESLTPNATFSFLNDYLEEMDPPVHENDGFIDKFIGDAFMDLFPRSPDGAVRAAIQMQQRLRIGNAKRKSNGQSLIVAGIGIHTGNVTLGTVGSTTRLNTTVVGDAVNLAARLEGLTKVYQVPIIISDAVHGQLSNPAAFNIREIDTVRVRGKRKAVDLYEVFDPEDADIVQRKIASIDNFRRVIFLYKTRSFKEAQNRFQECATICPEDGVARLYIERCRRLDQNPPPETWTGIGRLITEQTINLIESE